MPMPPYCLPSLFCFPCARGFIAQSLGSDQAPQCSRLTANLASTEGLVCGDSDAWANGFMPTTVRVKAQAAKG
jgi:hypothetical protein